MKTKIIISIFILGSLFLAIKAFDENELGWLCIHSGGILFFTLLYFNPNLMGSLKANTFDAQIRMFNTIDYLLLLFGLALGVVGGFINL